MRSLPQCVACDIHPIANLRVFNRLRYDLGVPESHVCEWIRHWISGLGFEAIEAQLDPRSAFLWGSGVTLADVCLVPQHFNAVRFETPLDAYPRIRAVVAGCNELPAFANALREAQG